MDITIWILFILLLICITLPIKELFYQKTSGATKEKVLTSQRLNFDPFLKKYQLVSVPPSGWEYTLFKLSTKQPLPIYGNPTKVIMDPMDYEEHASGYSKTILSPPGYFCVFTSPLKKDDFQCGFDLTGKKVGYFDTCEKRVIDTILYSYRTTARTVPLSFEMLPTLDTVWNTVDVIVVYLVPKSPLTKMIEAQTLVLLDISKISMDRLHVIHPYLSLVSLSKTDLFGTNHKISTPGNTFPLLRMSMVWVDISKTISETFISQVSFSKEFTDPTYRCLGDETIQSNALCKSPYDIYGNPKPTKTTWDKPCKSSNECPYYQANKNYPNTRGKCLPDGSCEMPLGVTRVGYTKVFHRDPYQPFCYQCKNPKDKDCCEAQEAQVAYTQAHPDQPPLTYLKSADYAFSKDTAERKRYGLPTYIRLPSS